MKTIRDCDLPVVVPMEVGVCTCGAELLLTDIDEWDLEGRVSVFSLQCSAMPDDTGDGAFDEWSRNHTGCVVGSMAELDEIYDWFDRNYRYGEEYPF